MRQRTERRPGQGYGARNEVGTSNRILASRSGEFGIALIGAVGLAAVLLARGADVVACLVAAYCGTLIGCALGALAAPRRRCVGRRVRLRSVSGGRR